MSGSRIGVASILAAIALAGCDEKCENGYKIKKEYSTIFWHESWHESSKDTLLDGAIRTETWTYKSGRVLEVRCFQAAPSSKLKQYDIRYSIPVPLLIRFVPEIEKAGPVEFIISIDGTPVATIPTRVIVQKEGIAFLSPIEPALIDKLEGARSTVVVMPRQKNERLDDIIEFKVAKLAEHIRPVKEACKSLRNKEESPAEKPKQETNRA